MVKIPLAKPVSPTDLFGLDDDDEPLARPWNPNEPPPTEIQCPLTGEMVSLSDVDGLIDLYERVDAFDKKLYAVKLAVRHMLGQMVVDCESKTRYVQGRRRKGKLTLPDETWDNSILKEAWFSFPKLASIYLRISEIKPNLREVKKLLKTSGDKSVEVFRDMVARARREPSGEPTLKIEE